MEKVTEKNDENKFETALDRFKNDKTNIWKWRSDYGEKPF
jgi:hypothetical protein